MGIAVDQASIITFANISGATTIVANTTATVAAGGFIVLSVGWWESTAPTLSTVTNTGSSTLSWTVDKQGKHSGANPNSAIVSAQAPSGLTSGATITLTFSASTRARFLGGMSFTGVATSSPVDVTGTTQSVNSTAWATNSMALSAGSVAVGASFNENASSSTPTSPATEFCDVNASGNGLTAAYRIESSAASYTVAGTWGASGQNVTNGVAYLAAAGGGGGGTTVMQLAALGVG